MIADFRQRLMASTLLVGAAAYANPAFAQATPPSQSPEAAQATAEAVAETPAQPESEIVVTGSRIARPDLESSSPIAVVGQQEFQLQAGSANVENVLNDLPQVSATTSGTSNNPGGGVATVNLRNLGSQRTLVLVNGRRYVSFDVNQIVDLNTVPASLIDRVDVVTGGQSAVYGSDAIAGVVNFILKRNFTGIQADASYGITEKGDGGIADASVTLGTNFDDGRGNVTIFGNYTKRYPTFAGERSFTRDALTETAGGLIAGGSSSVPQGRVNIPGLGDATGLIDPTTGETCDVQDFAGNVNSCFLATDAYNFSPTNYLQVPQERYMIMAMGQYEISDHFRPYAEMTFINNRVDNQLAATPISQGTPFADGVTGPINIQVNSPFLTPEFQAALATLDTDDDGFVEAPVWSFRSVQHGPRFNADDRNAYRMLGGIAGDLWGGFDYDASYMFSRTRNSQRQLNNLQISNFLAAVETVFQDPVTGDTSPFPIPGGVLVCRDASARAAGCVPANIFGQGNFTQEAIDFTSLGATNLEKYSTQVANFTITNNDLFDIGAGGIGVALGAEWRKEAGAIEPDSFLASGNVAGFNPGDPTSGEYQVREFFGETRIPILRESFIHKLELNGAIRFSKYSNEPGNVLTWAAGGELAPVRDLTLRGQYQKAVRGPSVNELFLGNTVSFNGNADFCGRGPIAAPPPSVTDPGIRAICEAQFAAAGAPLSNIGLAVVDDSTQVNPLTFLGGNPDLIEETAKTFTVGAVLQPRFLPRFTATVDYYNIKIEDMITFGVGTDNIGTFCFENKIQSFCDLIQRNAIGQIDSFSDRNNNSGGLKTSGIDVTAAYNMPLGPIIGPTSRANFNFTGSRLLKSDFTPVAALPEEVIDCVGKFGTTCGVPTPKWRHTFRAALSSGPVTLSGQWRYIGGAEDDDEANEFTVEKVGSRSYFDLTTLFDIGEHYQMAVGVSNLFDKDPPIGATAQSGGSFEQSNTFPTVYEVLGRQYFASARVKF